MEAEAPGTAHGGPGRRHCSAAPSCLPMFTAPQEASAVGPSSASSNQIHAVASGDHPPSSKQHRRPARAESVTRAARRWREAGGCRGPVSTSSTMVSRRPPQRHDDARATRRATLHRDTPDAAARPAVPPSRQTPTLYAAAAAVAGGLGDGRRRGRAPRTVPRRRWSGAGRRQVTDLGLLYAEVEERSGL